MGIWNEIDHSDVISWFSVKLPGNSANFTRTTWYWYEERKMFSTLTSCHPQNYFELNHRFCGRQLFPSWDGISKYLQREWEFETH